MRRHGKGARVELFAAPAASLLVVFCIFLFPRSGVGDRERCGCGVDLGPSLLPRVRGPDRLDRAPVLRIASSAGGAWSASLDGMEVQGGPDDEQGPDWKIPVLTELLEVKRHNWRLLNPGRLPPADLVLQAPGDFPARNLRRYLYSLSLADSTRVQLLLRGEYGAWYTAANLQLVALPEGCDALSLESFRTYEELARAVVALRREGRPALLSVVPR